MSENDPSAATGRRPAETGRRLPTIRPRSHPRIHLLPTLHDRIESAVVTRAVLQVLEPGGVAVELPTTVAGAALQAADRLPRVSVVLSEETGEEALAWICAPGDAFAEALRWAGERDVPRFFVDPDLPYAERHQDAVPDPHALWEIGAQEYMDRVTGAAGPSGEGDRQREAGMAYHVLQARHRLDREGAADRPLLVLVGAAHALPLAQRLEHAVAAPLARVHRSQVELCHLHPESLTGLLHDPPLAHAVYEMARQAATTGERPAPPDLDATLARRLSLVRHGLTLHTREEEGWGSARVRRVVEYALDRAGRSMTLDPPGDAAQAAPATVEGPDREALARVVWAVGSRSWSEQTREEAEPWQRRLFFDFGRRFARVTGQLVPGLYGWVVAARGVADDNLAWEVFGVARAFPWQEEAAGDVATARLDGEDLDLGTRRVRFRRRFFRVKKRWMRVPVREHPEPADPEEWLEGFDGGGLCSYPPEDVVVEDYGRFLKRKAGSVVAAERERVEPFSTSLLDGVDVRETLRHVDDGRIWVRESGRYPGEAGAVVVIYDRDPDNDFPYLMTWLGEHEGESDMAFYSSHPAEQVVGPGILRATYGGFLMTYPPGRLYDVWRDPDYRGLGDKAEILLAAAIDYSEEKLVAHVAAHPPSGRMRHYAAGQGKRIVHVPIGALSPQALKKIRVLHILVGHDKRAIAEHYVW